MGVLGAAQTFFGHIGNALGDGAEGIQDHFNGDTDHETAVRDDAAKENAASRTMLKGTLGGNDGLIATAGQAGADKWYAHEYPAAAGALNQDAASQMAKAKAGVIDQAYNDPFGDAAMVLPVAGAGRLATLGRLGKAMEAANAAGDGTRAARIGKAMEALRGGKAGTALRDAQARATEKLSSKAKATLAKGKAAVAKHRERQAAGRRDPNDPLSPHTDASLAKAKAEEARMHERWQQQGRHSGQGQGPALAHASDAPSSNHTPVIGKPESNPGMMQMAGEGAEGGAIARKPVIKPTGEVKGKPTGTLEECERGDNAEKKGKIARQNEAADALAYHGYKVEHKPKVLPDDHLNPDKKPDYRIEGQIFDGYTPTPGRTVDKIRNEISGKVKEGQANHIVLNLTDNSASVKDIDRILTGHKEVTGSTYGPLS